MLFSYLHKSFLSNFMKSIFLECVFAQKLLKQIKYKNGGRGEKKITYLWFPAARCYYDVSLILLKSSHPSITTMKNIFSIKANTLFNFLSFCQDKLVLSRTKSKRVLKSLAKELFLILFVNSHEHVIQKLIICKGNFRYLISDFLPST